MVTAIAWYLSAALASKYKVNVVQLTQDSCAVGYKDDHYDINAIPCPEFYRKAVETINSSPDINTVVISSTFSEVLDTVKRDSLNQLLKDLRTKKILVIGPTPPSPFNVGQCFKRAHFNPFLDNDTLNCNFSIKKIHNKIVWEMIEETKKFKNVNFVDITPFICPKAKCIMEPKPGLFMYVDHGHLSHEGAALIIKRLSKKNMLPVL